MTQVHEEDRAEHARLLDEAGCPPHCCCCRPGEPCCDCGTTMPFPPEVERIARAMAQASGRNPNGVTAPSRGQLGSRNLWELYVPQATAAEEAMCHTELMEAYEAALAVCHSAVDECRADKLVMVDGDLLQKLNDALTDIEDQIGGDA